MAQPKYLLVSLPQNISLANEHDEALTTLRSSVPSQLGTTFPFLVPTFKIGTLDALVQQADDLAKLSADCEATVSKVAESLSSLLEGDTEKLAQSKMVNDKPVEQYLRTFQWNKVKYRADKSIGELIETLRKEIAGVDNDIKNKFNQHNSTKNNLLTAERKQTGNLSTRSLASVVDPKLLVTDSEYLETHLIAVPTTSVKDFYKSYESLAPMVVPRSCMLVDKDTEFSLFAVTTFKKHGSEFVHKAREKRWTPRDFRKEQKKKKKLGGSGEDGGGDEGEQNGNGEPEEEKDPAEEEREELERLQKDERKLWGEALRLGRTGYSESAQTWLHVLALRVFVESVLRYGLPAEFVCGLIKCTPKTAKKAKGSLDASYAHLGGNALARDKKGRVQKDDTATSTELQAAGHGDADYTPYVFYEFEMA